MTFVDLNMRFVGLNASVVGPEVRAGARKMQRVAPRGRVGGPTWSLASQTRPRSL